MVADELKKRMFAAMKSKDDVAKETYRTALGELTKTGEAPTDERVALVLRKMLKSNAEALQHATGEAAETLRRESALLEDFLPKALDVAAIIAALESERAALQAAGNAGQATGLAMKALKAAGAEVDGKSVGIAVRAIRGET